MPLQATPPLIYSHCILRTVKDASAGSEGLPQRSWLWEFEQPLITEKDAERATIANRLKNDYILCPDMRQRSIAGCYQNNVALGYNTFVNKIDSGEKVTSSAWTNTANALGNTALGGSVSDVVSGLIGKLQGAFGL